MGAGAVATVAGARAGEYTGKVTWYVIITGIAAACAGLLFGYDIGVSGGVTSMPTFLAKFFPVVVDEPHAVSGNTNYCKYSDPYLQLFTSSLYLAGLVSAMIASFLSRRVGRVTILRVASILFLVGVGLQAGAVSLAMLVIGRVVLGFGVGLANQAAPVYLSEAAPAKIRGAMNIMFQMATTIGIFVAQLINYGDKDLEWGWRLSLALAAVPALLLLTGSLMIPESPNSLIERGRQNEGKAVLQRLRGVDDVEAEFQDIVQAAAASQAVPNPWATIWTARYRPQLVIAILIPIFQQLTGINAIMFYAPQLFDSLGSGSSAALLNTVIIGAVNVAATIVAIIAVDRLGRKILFLEGGTQMMLAEVIMGALLGYQFNRLAPGESFSTSWAIGLIIVVCGFVTGFAWSWGPLGWLVPTEVQPLETRAAGQGLTVGFNFLLTFIIGQAFLSMLCSMQWGVFIFFAAWVIVMTVFVALFLPETKGVPIEEVSTILFRKHWFWGPRLKRSDAKMAELAGEKPVAPATA